MRQATITIRWEGPDKPAREYISDHIDGLFEDFTMSFGDKLLYADADVDFKSKV